MAFITEEIIDELNCSLWEYADAESTGELSRMQSLLTYVNRAILIRSQESSRGTQGDRIIFDLVTLLNMRKSLKASIAAAKAAQAHDANGGFRLFSSRRRVCC